MAQAKNRRQDIEQAIDAWDDAERGFLGATAIDLREQEPRIRKAFDGHHRRLARAKSLKALRRIDAEYEASAAERADVWSPERRRRALILGMAAFELARLATLCGLQRAPAEVLGQALADGAAAAGNGADGILELVRNAEPLLRELQDIANDEDSEAQRILAKLGPRARVVVTLLRTQKKSLDAEVLIERLEAAPHNMSEGTRKAALRKVRELGLLKDRKPKTPYELSDQGYEVGDLLP